MSDGFDFASDHEEPPTEPETVGDDVLTQTTSEEGTPGKRTRGSRRDWMYMDSFPKLVSALKYVKKSPLLWNVTQFDEMFGSNGKQLETMLTRKSPNFVMPNKKGEKTHLYACAFCKTHGCKVLVRIVEVPCNDFLHHQNKHQDPIDMCVSFEVYQLANTKHEHLNYIGKQINYDMKVRTAQLADTLSPSQLRRQLRREGFDMDKK